MLPIRYVCLLSVFTRVSLPDLHCLMSQVQSIVNIASNTVSLLEKLSPSLRAVAKAASGMGSEQQHTFMAFYVSL